MVRRIALALVIVLGIATIPILSTQAATVTPSLKRVDGLLDRSLRELRAVELFADTKHLVGADQALDQAIRLTREAEKTVDQALAMVRQAGTEKLSRAQGERIEQLIKQAQSQLRQVEAAIDRVAKKSEDHKKLRRMVGRIDRHVDEALKLLHQVVAKL